MSVPTLRFKEFSQTLTPENFGHVISANKYGPRFDASDYDTNGNVKTIRGTDVSLDGEIKYSQVPRAKLDENFIKDNLLNDGDLIMITTADCGLTGVFRKQEIEYIPSAYAVKIELNELGFPYYFKYYFQTKRVKDEINKYVRKGTVANLPLSDIGKISIKLPNIVEQTKIANFLTAVDEKITQLTQKHVLLTQYKKSVMQQIFSQELRFKDNDGQDFADWELSSLEDMEKESLLELGRGNVISKTDIDKIKGAFPIYSSSVRNYGLFGHYGLFMFDEELITWSIDGGGDFFYRKKHKFSVTNVSGFLRITSEKINCKFLSYQLIHLHKKLSFDYQTKAHPSVIRSLYVVQIPAVEEQVKIANFLSAIDDKITATLTQLQAVKQYKQGLLQQMFV